MIFGLSEDEGSEKNTQEKPIDFRVHAKNLFLTYARAPDSWTLEYLRDKLVNEIIVYDRGNKSGQTRVRAYVISEEDHKEPIGEGDYERGRKHYHCLIELKEKIDIKSQDFLDVDGIHGNYQKVMSLKSTRNYVKKHGQFIESGLSNILAENDRALLEAKTDQDAKLFLMGGMSIRDKLKMREDMITLTNRRTVIEEIVAQAPVYAFQEVLVPFWEQSGFNKVGRPIGLLMYGEPKSGKTTLAYKIAKELNQDLMVVNDLKEMTEHYNGEQIILLDEMSKEVFEKNDEFISALITEPQAKTKSYYGTKKIKWPRKVLIATNEDVEEREWKFSAKVKERLLLVKVFADGKYQYQSFLQGKLKNLSIEEVKEIIT